MWGGYGVVNERLTQAFISMHFCELTLNHDQGKLDERIEKTSGLTEGSRERKDMEENADDYIDIEFFHRMTYMGL